MAEDSKQPVDDFASLLADAPELWQLADQFAHSLPVHTTLLMDALRRGCAEELRRTSAQLTTKRKPPTHVVLRTAQLSSDMEEQVVGDLAARMDDLTATILKIQVQLQNNID
jgi:hypothetical protein